MPYTRRSEYKLVSEWFNIRRRKSEHNKRRKIKYHAETKKYLEFCKTFDPQKLIKSPTRVTLNTSTFIDHILTNTNEKIT